jgi:hypothetical protein
MMACPAVLQCAWRNQFGEVKLYCSFSVLGGRPICSLRTRKWSGWHGHWQTETRTITVTTTLSAATTTQTMLIVHCHWTGKAELSERHELELAFTDSTVVADTAWLGHCGRWHQIDLKVVTLHMTQRQLHSCEDGYNLTQPQLLSGEDGLNYTEGSGVSEEVELSGWEPLW